MRVIGGRIVESRINGEATVDGIYYQLTGTVMLTTDDKPNKIHEGEGTFIPRGARLVIKPVGEEPAMYSAIPAFHRSLL